MQRFPNSSIELVRYGKHPRRPLTNDQRLQLFRSRSAKTSTTEFNTVFPAGRVAQQHPKEQQQ
jgi:hypothetical protein